MFGATVGALNVYFKEENDLVPRLMFSKEGDQGNHWLHSIFTLPKGEKGFQVREKKMYCRKCARQDTRYKNEMHCSKQSEDHTRAVYIDNKFYLFNSLLFPFVLMLIFR